MPLLSACARRCAEPAGCSRSPLSSRPRRAPRATSALPGLRLARSMAPWTGEPQNGRIDAVHHRDAPGPSSLTQSRASAAGSSLVGLWEGAPQAGGTPAEETFVTWWGAAADIPVYHPRDPGATTATGPTKKGQTLLGHLEPQELAPALWVEQGFRTCLCDAGERLTSPVPRSPRAPWPAALHLGAVAKSKLNAL